MPPDVKMRKTVDEIPASPMRVTEAENAFPLVRQPHFVIFEALSLVVALFRSCLVDPSPGGPVVGVVARVDGVAQGGPEAPDFVAGQGNQVLDAACGAPF
jgi:hypothetical protein